MRNDFTDKSKVLVAGKAGMNDDPHHGHLDIGHFVVYWQEEYFIQDLGRIGYDEKYFDQARYDYPEAASIGHNTILVNGEKQIPGKEYKQSYDYNVGGEVLEFRTTAKQDYVLMDPSNAYPKKELQQWQRHVVLNKPNITCVLDEVHTAPDADIEVRFHSAVSYDNEEEFVFLRGKEGHMALIPFSTQPFRIKEDRHASQFVNGTKSFDWIPYFDTELTAATDGKTIIGTLILPVNNVEEARKLVASKKMTVKASGDLSVQFSSGGKRLSFDFVQTDDGLVLKE